MDVIKHNDHTLKARINGYEDGQHAPRDLETHIAEQKGLNDG